MSPATLSSPIKVHLDALSTIAQENQKMREDVETKFEMLEKRMDKITEDLGRQQRRHDDKVKKLTKRVKKLENEMAQLVVTMQNEKVKLKQEATEHLAAEKQSLSKQFNKKEASLQPQIDELNDALATANQRIVVGFKNKK